MTTEILKDEVLSAEQLDLVSGGSSKQDRIDNHFFWKLGYDIDDSTERLKKLFAIYGVEYTDHWGDNDYKINGNKYPHWAALGYVLSKHGVLYDLNNFNGSWTDSNYVNSFLDKNFDTNTNDL